MKTEFHANTALSQQAQELAAERARWAAVLAPSKPATPSHADHVARGHKQGFKPLGRFQWLAMGMIAAAGPR